MLSSSQICSNDIVRINDFICCLSSLLVESATNIIIDDFNFKEIDWACIDASGYSPHHLFSKFLLDHGFSQFVLEPTLEASILDLVLCDNLYTIDHVYCTENFSTSDHNSVSFCVNTLQRVLVISRHLSPILLRLTGITWVSCFRSSNWRDVVSYNSCIDHCWANFYDILSQAVRIFVPVRRVSTNSVSRKLVLPNYIRKLRLIKLKRWRALRKLSFDPILKIQFKTAAKASKEAITNRHIAREHKIISSGNTATHFKYINNKLGLSKRVDSIINNNDELINDPFAIAEAFKYYFALVYTHDNGNLPPFAPVAASELNTCLFSPSAVFNILQHLK